MPISYSRAQLEAMLNSGQSVIINGRHIDRLEDLPSESELAIGDRERMQAAIRAHEDQIATLTREREKLQKQLDEAPNQPPAPETPPQPARAGDGPAQPAPGAAPTPPEAPKPFRASQADAPKPPDSPPADAPSPPRPGQPLFTPPPPRVPTPPDEGEGDDRGRARGRRGA